MSTAINIFAFIGFCGSVLAVLLIMAAWFYGRSIDNSNVPNEHEYPATDHEWWI